VTERPFEVATPARVLGYLQRALGAPVMLASAGPTHADVRSVQPTRIAATASPTASAPCA
jgi:hypothetical protein